MNLKFNPFSRLNLRSPSFKIPSFPILPRRRTLLGIALGSGIGMGLAPAPVNAWGLAWVALVPLWVMVCFPYPTVRSLRSRLYLPWGVPTQNTGLWVAVAWGLGYYGTALSWILGLHPLTWMGIPWLGSVAIALFAWVFITLWGTALVVIWAAGVRGLNQVYDHVRSRSPHLSIGFENGMPSGLRVLSATALWCGLEWLWSRGPLWWSSLSYTQSPGNLWILHLGQVSGAMTVTAAIVAVNGCWAEAWLRRRVRDRERDRPNQSLRHLLRERFRLAQGQRSGWISTGLALVVLLHLGGGWLYAQPLADVPMAALRIGIIQGNVPTRIKLAETGIRQAFQNYTEGYIQLAEAGVDAVLTPEGALPVVWDGQLRHRSDLYQAILRYQVPAWISTFIRDGDRYTQSLLTVTGDGDVVSRYNKIKLVPLGEYIPLQETLGAIIRRLSPIDSRMEFGRSDQRFDTPLGRAIVSICYESAYPDLFRRQASDGGRFILTASNLDPYSEVLMAQHQALDIMRAIETDRWAARATNTGYSGVVDPHGRVQWRSPSHAYLSHAETLYRRQTQTLYVLWGNWLTPLLVLGAIVGHGLVYTRFCRWV